MNSVEIGMNVVGTIGLVYFGLQVVGLKMIGLVRASWWQECLQWFVFGVILQRVWA